MLHVNIITVTVIAVNYYLRITYDLKTNSMINKLHTLEVKLLWCLFLWTLDLFILILFDLIDTTSPKINKKKFIKVVSKCPN